VFFIILCVPVERFHWNYKKWPPPPVKMKKFEFFQELLKITRLKRKWRPLFTKKIWDEVYIPHFTRCLISTKIWVTHTTKEKGLVYKFISFFHPRGDYYYCLDKDFIFFFYSQKWNKQSESPSRSRHNKILDINSKPFFFTFIFLSDFDRIKNKRPHGDLAFSGYAPIFYFFL
jgi:hypothetical protein